jgi:hypothetical protein
MAKANRFRLQPGLRLLLFSKKKSLCHESGFRMSDEVHESLAGLIRRGRFSEVVMNLMKAEPKKEMPESQLPEALLQQIDNVRFHTDSADTLRASIQILQRATCNSHYAGEFKRREPGRNILRPDGTD